MDAERFSRLDELFNGALNLSGEDLDNFLNSACGQDTSLRSEIDALLAQHEIATGPLDKYAANIYLQGETVQAHRQPEVGSRYRPLQLLGTGGTGEVWLAEDVRLSRKIALKVLRHPWAADPDSAARLTREARTASALNHPNILTIYDVGEYNGLHFLASEYIEGPTLRQILKKSKPELSNSIKIAAQIADALSAAHNAGVIHRDIKPENVIVRSDGRITVLDFGIAKWADGIPREGETSVLTAPAAILGTVAYLSPEQARGIPVDARTDIWSLGVVLFEMISGRRPFEGESDLNVVAAILTMEPPRLSLLCPQIPRALESVVRKALAKELADRFSSAGALKKQLEDLGPVLEAAGQPVWKLPALRAKPFKLLFALTVISLAVVVIFIAIYTLRAHRPESFARFTMDRFTSAGNVATAALSPDGHYITYSTREADRESLWVRQAGEQKAIQIVAPKAATYLGLTFRMEDDSIYYVLDEGRDENTLYHIPILGGSARKVLDDIDSPVSFSSDEQRFAFVRNNPEARTSSLYVAKADGTGEQTLVIHPERENFISPAWSQNGDLIAAIIAHGPRLQPDFMTLNVIDAKRKHEERIGSASWKFVTGLAWVGNQDSLIFAAPKRNTFLFQLHLLAYPKGVDRELTNDLLSYSSVSSSSNGRSVLALQKDRFSALWVSAPTDFRKGRFMTAMSGRYYGVSWLADDRLISRATSGGASRLCTLDIKTGDLVQMTPENHAAWGATASADGRSIAFASNEDGRWTIWRMDADGRNLVRLSSKGMDQGLVWSPDGRWLLFTSSQSGQRTIWRVPSAGGEPSQVTKAPSWAPAISSDGQHIVCTYLDQQNGGRWVKAITDLDHPDQWKTIDNIPAETPIKWSRDGRGLTYVLTNRDVSNIWYLDIKTGVRKQLTKFEEELIFDFDWSSEGRLACVRGHTVSDAVILRQ